MFGESGPTTPRWFRAGVIALTVGAVVTAPIAPAMAAPDDPMPIPPACSAPSDPDPIDTVTVAAALLTATWLRCAGDPPLFAVDEGEHVGLEFTTDGRFARVFLDVDGSLISAEGLQQEGRWEIQGVNASAAMLSMTLMGNGTLHAETTFADSGSSLRIMGEDGVTREYARWDGETPERGLPVDADPGPCGPLTPPMAFDDVAAATNLAIGTWIRCDGPSPFAAQEGDDVGLELTSSGRFFRVYESAQGLIRAEGVLQEGRWVINDVYTTGAPSWSTLDLGLKLSGSGYFPFGVTVHNDGEALVFDDSMTGTSSGYSRWSGPAPTPGLPAGIGAGACGHPTGPVQPSSSDELAELLVGSWTVCAGEPFGPGVIGVEFVADGSFRAQVRSADGRVVLHEDSTGATWRLVPFAEPFDVHNGPQIDVVYPDGSTLILQPELFSSPLFMTLWPDSGLLAGAPQPLPGPVEPLPPTGTDAPTKLLVLGGMLVAVGAFMTRRSARAGR